MTATERLKAIRERAERASYEEAHGPYRSMQQTDVEKIIGLCECLEKVVEHCKSVSQDRKASYDERLQCLKVLEIINRELGGEA